MTSIDLSALSEEFAAFQKNARMPDEIEYPIQVSAVEATVGRDKSDRVGRWCSIRPASDSRTYLGIYLGDLILNVDYYYRVDNQKLTISPHTNPAIFVPDLKRIVWGCESWWGFVDSPDQLRQISDADIQNVWYVKALKELMAEAGSS